MSDELPDLFKSNPERIAVLLAEIDGGKLALPNFQRDFKWPAALTAKLLSSVMARYPAGALLLWRPGEKTLDPRPISGAPKVPDVPGLPERLILDGQQRLTSLYRALRKDEHSPTRFHINLRAFVKEDTFELIDSEEIDWDAVVAVRDPTPAERRALKKNGTPPPYTAESWQVRLWEFPAHLLYDTNAFPEWLDKVAEDLPEGADGKKLKKSMRAAKKLYLDQLSAYTFPVVTLTSDASLAAVCRIFETLNSNAVKLGVFEVLTARFYASKPSVDLRALWAESKKKHKILQDALPKGDDNKFGFSVDPYTVLQVISLRRLKTLQQRKLTDGLTSLHIQEDWHSAAKALADVLSHLNRSQGVVHPDLLPYTMVLVPMAAAWLDRETMKGQGEKAAALDKIEKYFWASAFTTNFDQGGASQADRDCADLLKWLGDKKDEDSGEPIRPEAIDRIPIAAETLLAASYRKKALLAATMALTVKEGAEDFSNGQPLVPALYVDGSIHSHHIFPQSLLKSGDLESGGYSPDLLLNRALIDASSNIKINNKRPSVYIDELADGGASIEDLLHSHLISIAELSGDDYPAFLNTRLARLVEKVEEVTGKTVTPLPEDAEPGGEDTDDEADVTSDGVATPDVPDTLVVD